MPSLAQMISLANSKTDWSRPDEVIPALDEAGRYVYNAVLKEFRGFFLKFDETSLVFQVGTQEYTLPADCTQIVHLAERATATSPWLEMFPVSLGTALQAAQDQVGWDYYYASGYGDSDFSYYGPYLDAASAVGTQVQKIRVSPLIDQTRYGQLVYTAKWLPINNPSSPMMLPEEGTYPMMNFAIAELHRGNDDTLKQDYEAKAEKSLTSFLTWLRARQIQQPPQVEPYLL